MVDAFDQVYHYVGDPENVCSVITWTREVPISFRCTLGPSRVTRSELVCDEFRVPRGLCHSGGSMWKGLSESIPQVRDSWWLLMVTQWLSCPNRKPLFSPAALPATDRELRCRLMASQEKDGQSRLKKLQKVRVLEAEIFPSVKSEVAGWFLSHHLPSGNLT